MENKITPKQALEELQVEWEFNNKELPRGFVDTRYEIIEQALTELEETKKINEIFKNAITIKHAGINFEEKLDQSKDTFIYSIQPICEVIQNNIEKELKKQLREWVLKNAFPQELQILEVLKEHFVNRDNDTSGIYFEKHLGYYEPYYQIKLKDGIKLTLTETEFNLIKEWLK